jgi:hypothetical protein
MAPRDFETPSPLGPWTEADLQATASEHSNEGADQDLPPAVRFFSAVTKLLRRRLANPAAGSDPKAPSVFILDPDPDPSSVGDSLTRVPVLNNGTKPVVGSIWFVSELANAGKKIAAGTEDDSALIERVVQCLRLGDRPALLFEPRTGSPSVRFFPRGLSHADDCIEASLASNAVTLDVILNLIDRCHRAHLCTPDATQQDRPVWTDKDRHRPVANAERRIQGYLRIFLSGALPGCTVREEQSDTIGRLDIEVEEPIDGVPFGFRRLAILELKVLRSFGSGGASVSRIETLDWIKGGVLQAAAYRDERSAAEAALCCFDMRRDHEGDRCFEHVLVDATARKVRLRCWPIFNSSEAFRRHQQCAT